MRSFLFASLASFALLAAVARDAHADPPSPPSPPSLSPEAPRPTVVDDKGGDLFVQPGHLSLSAATGLPFLGITEVAVGVTEGFSLGVIGGITPSVLTAGLRPRFRVHLSDAVALMLVAPMLYYPSASAPGPGNIGKTSWVLTRPELLVDTRLGARWHLGFGMGIIAAASTDALVNKLEGKSFVVPAYGNTPAESFAGGVWNTLCFHTSYAIGARTHFFAEGSLVLAGVVPATDVGGPPIVVTTGLQQSF